MVNHKEGEGGFFFFLGGGGCCCGGKLVCSLERVVAFGFGGKGGTANSHGVVYGRLEFN